MDEFYRELDEKTAPHYTEYSGQEYSIDPSVAKGVDVDHPEL